MKRFQLSVDNIISIQVDGASYFDTINNFVLDAQSAIPVLPEKAAEWRYIDDGNEVLNRLFDSKGNQLGESDIHLQFIHAVLLGINVLITRQVARNAVPIVPPTAPDLSDFANTPKSIKALGLAIATLTGKTPSQIIAAYRTAWDSLP